MPTDNFGTDLNMGDIVLFGFSSKKIDVGVVSNFDSWEDKNKLEVSYIFNPKGRIRRTFKVNPIHVFQYQSIVNINKYYYKIPSATVPQEIIDLSNKLSGTKFINTESIKGAFIDEFVRQLSTCKVIAKHIPSKTANYQNSPFSLISIDYKDKTYKYWVWFNKSYNQFSIIVQKMNSGHKLTYNILSKTYNPQPIHLVDGIDIFNHPDVIKVITKAGQRLEQYK